MTVLKGTGGRLGERGQALAEFALVLPLLLLMIAGIVEFARAWNIKQAVTDAAREGIRHVVIADDKTLADAEDKIEERLALSSIETSTITFSAAAPCASAAACFHETGRQMSVNVSTQYRMAFIGTLLKWAVGSRNVTISTRATMRNE
jgi:Flp pilus assembly protein TadG